MESTTLIVQDFCSICSELLKSSEKTELREIMEQLKFLFKVNWRLLEHSLICKSCLAKIQSACKFKNLYVEGSRKTNETDTKRMCEICKDIVAPSNCIPLFDSVTKTKLNFIRCLSPELVSKIKGNPKTCKQCHKSLLSFCTITQLLSTFTRCNISRIRNLDNDNEQKESRQAEAGCFKVNVKKEMNEAQDAREGKEDDTTVYENFKIKNEEVDVKTEFVEDSEQMWQHSDQETATNSAMLDHKNSKSDCDEALKYKTIYRSIRHTVTHREINKTRVYKCRICEHETKYKRNLKQHMRIHIIRKVETFKCQVCEYQTKHKRAFKRHMLLHKSSDEIEMFTCQICEYQTKYKDYLKKHVLLHEKSEEVSKCPNCEYKTRRTFHFERHVRKCPDGVEMFKCQICAFETKYKSYLKRHSLCHKNIDEVEIFKCQRCEFTTKYKYYLNRHLLTHKNCDKNPNEVKE